MDGPTANVHSGPVVQIRLLGGVSAAAGAGEMVDLGPAKCRAVLAALALSPGEAVPVTRLVDLVWGQDPPRTAEKTLQGYVARLRRSIGAAAIVRTGAAYRLDVGAEAVDAHRFQRYVAIGDVEAALTEWRGMPLAGLDVPGLAPAAEGLVEQWLGAVEADLERRVAADPPAAVAALTQLTADHPFREGLWALLMTVLYRSGRQRDALAAYQRARRHLVEELGVEPGPRLTELEGLILGHDEQLRPHAEPTASTVASARRGNLPQRSAWLFGRDNDRDAVVEAVEASPVVTLVGPGGIGKTSLALAAARRWQDEGHDDRQRVWLVELAEIAASGDVPRAVATALGVAERSGATLTDSVVAALGSRPALLVLDNCEHVIDGAAALVRAVADHTPDSRVLATSRERLAIVGEQLVSVAALDPAGAAADLFAERARAVSGEFRLEECRSDVVEVCRRLDGVPLAIELAAARARTLPPSELLSRLDDSLRLLTTGDRAGADRHRTLRATIQWSYDLLSPAQRRLFERLSVFTGPFDLAAAEAVAADADVDTVEVDHLLGDLVERSMVTPEPGRFGPRFRLLETLRHFADQHLAAQDEAEGISRRHAQWCRRQVAAIHDLLTGPGEIEGVARLAELWPNLRTAVGWACTTGDLALADALVRPIAPEVNLRRQAEIGDWAERILDLTAPDDEATVVFWLTWAAERHTQAGDRAAYERVVGRHADHADHADHAAHPLMRYAHAAQYEDPADLAAASPAAVAWLRRHGAGHAAGLLEVTGVASGLMAQGRFGELDAVASEMVDRYRQGPPTLLYFAWGLLGFSAQFQGRHDEANRFFAQSADIEVPAGTYLVNRTVEARAVFDGGEPARAFRMLRDHVDTVLATDYVDVARMVAVEFVAMTAAADRLADAALVLSYLDTTGGFGARARETLLADAVRRIAADPDVTVDDGDAPDGRQALAHMREVLDDLAGGAPCRAD